MANGDTETVILSPRGGDATRGSAGDVDHVLAIKLETGDELEIDAGRDAAAAREQLASFYGDLDTHKFVRFDDDTVVRSSQIAYMQLRARSDSEGGVLETVKSRFTGGKEMTMYGDEHDRGGATTMRPTGSRSYSSGGRATQPLFDGRGRSGGSETKPFFLTSEFLTTAGIIAGLAIAMSQLDNFDANRGWLLITAIAAAYVLSRGIAKAGTRSQSDDPRDHIGWGDDR